VLSIDGGGEITADDAAADKIVFWDDSASKLTYLALGDGVAIDGTTIYAQDWFVIAASDEATSLTTGTNKVYFRMPYAATLLAVRATVNTAPTGSTLIVDINEAGTSLLSTKLSIDASETTSTTAATAAVISDSALADDAEMTIDIDQVGSTIAGKGLKVYLKVRRG
jgi:exopolysaccharide biosynthesis protein